MPYATAEDRFVSKLCSSCALVALEQVPLLVDVDEDAGGTVDECPILVVCFFS
jgi:hypothetical protein